MKFYIVILEHQCSEEMYKIHQCARHKKFLIVYVTVMETHLSQTLMTLQSSQPVRGIEILSARPKMQQFFRQSAESTGQSCIYVQSRGQEHAKQICEKGYETCGSRQTKHESEVCSGSSKD